MVRTSREATVQVSAVVPPFVERLALASADATSELPAVRAAQALAAVWGTFRSAASLGAGAGRLASAAIAPRHRSRVAGGTSALSRAGDGSGRRAAEVLQPIVLANGNIFFPISNYRGDGFYAPSCYTNVVCCLLLFACLAGYIPNLLSFDAGPLSTLARAPCSSA